MQLVGQSCALYTARFLIADILQMITTRSCHIFALLTLFTLTLWANQNILAAVSSGSVQSSADGSFLYTANFDAGSLTRTNLTNVDNQIEVQLGKDIRRLAISSDGNVLAASDYLSKSIFLLNAQTLETQARITTGRRPFAIVYDEKRSLFWATIFEDGQLIGFDRKGVIQHQLQIAETPRGLALTDDNRLLITHALTGELSIYDLSATTPKLIKTIKLKSIQKEDEFSSQGVPRLLDDIAISPNGSEAWLPHLLWNLDHPFQFQSTIFPAVSVIDLTPGAEAEKVDLRKELFRQINVVDNANRTRIVSNPHDAEFSANGKRLYVTLAGSEDLMVVDLSRRSSGKKKKRSKRRKGKKSKGGAQVTQILRHLPGDNPKGLVVINDNIYVQNAISQDITKISSGGSKTFARAAIETHPLYKSVKNDPLSPQERLGVRLFNSGNSSEFPDGPMAGDFWMSCNSCHLDGFNFTNRFLMADGRSGRNKFEDAVTGHRDIIKMFAGAPESALADVIQKTQGGMGADEGNSSLEPVDPKQLPAPLKEQMQALMSYITAAENLPFLSTWLRLEGSEKTAHKSEWLNSASCAECHPAIFSQWANSNHGTLMDHPYYRFQENYAAEQEGEEFRNLCRGCHMPQALLSGEAMPQSAMANMHEKEGVSLHTALTEGRPVVEAGTGCLFCHRIVNAENAGGNADLTVNIETRSGYLFEGSNNMLSEWLANRMINAKPEAHKTTYSNPKLYQDSLYCATCHNEFTSGPGAEVNDNYGEWLASSFNDPKNPEKHKTCIDCHMHADIERIGEPIPGRSTVGGPIKKNVRTHHFVGANNSLVGLRSEEHKGLSEALLKSAAKLDSRIEGDQLIVTVNNVNGGHKLPGGARRQLWLEVTVTDKNQQTVFTSGHLDQDNRVPKDARKFHKVGGDKHGNKVGLSFWRYEKMLKDTRIPANGSRDEHYLLPDNLAYPLNIKVRLLFKAFSKGLTDKVRAAFPKENIPYAPIVEMTAHSKIILSHKVEIEAHQTAE